MDDDMCAHKLRSMSGFVGASRPRCSLGILRRYNWLATIRVTDWRCVTVIQPATASLRQKAAAASGKFHYSFDIINTQALATSTTLA